MKIALEVKGMRCESCASKVAEAIERVSGVQSATVSVATGQALVAADADVGHEEVSAAASVGGEFQVTPVDKVTASAPETTESLFPLFLIVGFIAGTTLLVAAATDVWATKTLMRHFMAGFFLVFSFFKLLDLRGFSSTYQTYDLLAKRAPAWGLAYPFVELGLGASYILVWSPQVTNLSTLVLMSVGAIGVLQALRKKQTIRCACLGTVLNLPMTKVTLTEDLVMAGMAGAMLLLA